MTNMKLWDRLGKTDPAHTKSFTRAGGFKGTAIKPMWSYKMMTEVFGACGQGWGINQPSFQTVSGYNGEVMVYCTVSIWWNNPDQQNGPHTVFGVGGDKVVTYIKPDPRYSRPERWENDDEAFKKAYTDAVTNALKMIGVGADVHMGMFDDNKYVNTLQAEFKAEEKDKDKTKEAVQEPKGPSKNEESRKVYKYLQEDLQKLKGVQECRAWWSDADVQEQVRLLPADWAKELKNDWIFTGKRLAAHEEGKNIGDAVDDIVKKTGGTVTNDRFVENFFNGEPLDVQPE